MNAMTQEPNSPSIPNLPNPRRPRALRIWPGVAIVALQYVGRYAVPAVIPIPMVAVVGVLGGVVLGALVLVWWLFFSRAAWAERLEAVMLMAVGLFSASKFLHPSIAGGMMGMMYMIYVVPILSLAFVAWAAATRGFGNGFRRVSMAFTILLACDSMMLVRTDGMTGGSGSQFAWRWAKTPEELMLARSAASARNETAIRTKPLDQITKPAEQVPAASTRVEWPGFRGPGRDAAVHGLRIETDWSQAFPALLWRREIGPGWSSFAIADDVFYTQEQRGGDEIVACYKMTNGEPVWQHRDAVRFWESNAGAGPRATPTLGNGRVYAFGATGILNALDAETGALVWSRDAASDCSVKVPGWGFSSSPLVVGDVVIIAATGKLAAYDMATGKPRWIGASKGGGYSSPHPIRIDGIPQVVLLSDRGATSVDTSGGSLLWEYFWEGSAIIQPAVTVEGDLLISTGGGVGGLGVRRLAVTRTDGKWTVKERWTSQGLKPYFNDLVVHKGHAYGFDGSILSCISLEDGARKWKGGRYGNGQILLLADQDALLVLSEEGGLALVGAAPDGYRELARCPGIKGKTWNHPALAGSQLLVRNGEEMAAFRLALAR